MLSKQVLLFALVVGLRAQETQPSERGTSIYLLIAFILHTHARPLTAALGHRKQALS